MNAGPIRVAVNALHAKSGGGLTYLRNLLPLLAEDLDFQLHVFVHDSQLADFANLPESIRLHGLRFRSGFVRLLLWEQLALPRALRAIRPHVVLSAANYGPLAPRNHVIVLQNSLAVGDKRSFSKRLYWVVLGIMTTLSLLRARAAIAVSDYVVRSVTGRRLCPIHTIPHGVSPAFHPGTEPREDFLLAVGDLYVQKNFAALIQAMDIIRHPHPHIRLKVAGRPIDGGYADALNQHIRALGVQDHVEFLGGQTQAQVAELMRRCALFVFPSVEESFGMPVLEAMASGCAIVCSDAAAMPEVAGDTVRYFPPADSTALARVVLDLLGQPQLRAELGQRAMSRAAGFSWAETARRTGHVLKQAAKKEG